MLGLSFCSSAACFRCSVGVKVLSVCPPTWHSCVPHADLRPTRGPCPVQAQALVLAAARVQVGVRSVTWSGEVTQRVVASHGDASSSETRSFRMPFWVDFVI